MKRILVMVLVTLTLALTPLRADSSWIIVYPMGGQMYQTSSTIVGGGMTFSLASEGYFVFTVRSVNAAGIVVDVVEDAVTVYPIPIMSTMPGMIMRAWVGAIAPPAGGWALSPPVAGMAGMRTPDHYTSVEGSFIPLLPFTSTNTTGPHTVSP